MCPVKKIRKRSSITKRKNVRKDVNSKKNDPEDWRHTYLYWAQKEIPDSALDLLAQKIVRIVNDDPEILTLNRVLARCKVHGDKLLDYVERSHSLKKAREYALFMIGVNREEKALSRKIDGRVMSHMQGMYDKSWARQEERHAELRRNIQSDNTTKIIVMKDFESKPDPKK